MTMIDIQTIAQIKACEGVYSMGDTARHFGVSKDTVHRIWTGKAHTNVPAAVEPANVISTRVPAEVIVEDGERLLGRGMSVAEAARQLGVSKTTMYQRLKEAGVTPCYFG